MKATDFISDTIMEHVPQFRSKESNFKVWYHAILSTNKNVFEKRIHTELLQRNFGLEIFFEIKAMKDTEKTTCC